MKTTRDRIIAAAQAAGWETRMDHHLLMLAKQTSGRCYLAQVLFKTADNWRWDYALTYDRPGYYVLTDESEVEIVPRMRDFLEHLTTVP